MPNTKNSSSAKTHMCQTCGLRPKYYDKGIGKLHPFCGKRCAGEAKQNRLESCSLTGCKQPPTVYPIGTYWNYCSPDHEELALRGCISCRAVPYIGDYFPICAPCDSYLVGRGPFLLPVPQDHATYWAVHDQFTATWTHPIGTQRAEVRMVYRIIPAPSVWDNYWAYREVLEAKGRFSAQGKYPGNEHLLWHGTLRACRVGELGQNVFCTNSGCSLCSIARGSFNVASAKSHGFQRFGQGIYTSSKSSKSDNYAKNKISSPWKAMLLNNVLAGSEYTTKYDSTHLKEPPQGYDSVYGEPGGGLNYDELVVYTDHAIRPAYLVMYEFVPK